MHYCRTLIAIFFVLSGSVSAQAKQTVNAAYIPLADHYAAIVAFERYGQQMQYADFRIHKMRNWNLLRAYFLEGSADMAFVMSPLAIDMYRKKPSFRWIGLMHRDGNALAINDKLLQKINLSANRADRKPTGELATVFASYPNASKRPVEIAVPHILSTHTVVLYKYLNQYGVNFTLNTGGQAPVLLVPMAPPLSPLFIKRKNARAEAAAFEQSLPWADLVETGGFGKVAWYSKDVMAQEKGHVECIVLASDAALTNKHKAIAEVMHFIKKAGTDIDIARYKGGKSLDQIIRLIRKHIPGHTKKSIEASLDSTLNVIRYNPLEIDKEGLGLIQNLAVEAGILSDKIDLDEFAYTDLNYSERQENPGDSEE